MPNLYGLTMREAYEKMQKLGLDFRFVGSGIVVRQDPEPKDDLDPSRQYVVIFSSPSQIMEDEEDD